MTDYPNGTFWSIAPHLSSRQQRVSWLETPVVGYGLEPGASASFYQQILPTPAGVKIYDRPTVMLMDERSESQAEHTGL